jgi:hypothetical protein
MSEKEPTPHEAAYHTFEFRDSNRRLASHPPDWYDGNPKRCPGSGEAPGVQYHGIPLEVVTDKLRHTRYEPSGLTGDPEFQMCTSVLDLVAQWIDKRFGGKAA